MTSTDSPTATVHNVSRHSGIAGQYEMRATVEYPGEGSTMVTFIGSTYGGPIVMALPSGLQTFISSAVTNRIGSTLDESWVRAFFAH